MRVLVACEYSGVVRNAFTALGHDATSCDLLPTETPGPHHIGDVRDLLGYRWDLMIAFPPCTHLAASGARWWPGKIADGRQQDALDFVLDLFHAPIDKVCIENPVGLINTRIRPADQTIQPWQYGHPEQKTTCLWLRGLPKLRPTRYMRTREQRMFKMSEKPNRGHERSRTYPGIAAAMAQQWGGKVEENAPFRPRAVP